MNNIRIQIYFFLNIYYGMAFSLYQIIVLLFDIRETLLLMLNTWKILTYAIFLKTYV